MLERRQLTLPLSRVPIIWPAQFYDDCEGLFDWVAAGDGADYDCEYADDACLVGNHSLLLRTKATAPALADAVSATRRLWITPLKAMNLQFAFAPTTGATKNLAVSLYWYDGTNVTTCSLRFNCVPPSVEFFNAASGWTAIADTAWFAGSGYWNYCSMLVDINALTWLPGQFNQHIIQTETPALPAGLDGTNPHLLLIFAVTAGAAARAGFWIDQILLTPQNP